MGTPTKYEQSSPENLKWKKKNININWLDRMARLGANPFHWRSPGASSHFGVLRKCAVLKVSVLCWEILSALEDKIRILKRPVTSSISLAQEEAENFLNLIRFWTIPSFHRRFVLSYLNAVRSCLKLSPQPAFSKGIHFSTLCIDGIYLSGFLGS